MAREIFVDASFWTALFYPRDERHHEAQSLWSGLQRGGWLTVTTNWTLYETLTFLSNRGNHALATHALDLVLGSTGVVHVERASLENLSLDIFRRHADKRWSVVDCANFACIQILRCEYALSYDQDFRQAQNEFNSQLLAP